MPKLQLSSSPVARCSEGFDQITGLGVVGLLYYSFLTIGRQSNHYILSETKIIDIFLRLRFRYNFWCSKLPEIWQKCPAGNDCQKKTIIVFLYWLDFHKTFSCHFQMLHSLTFTLELNTCQKLFLQAKPPLFLAHEFLSWNSTKMLEPLVKTTWNCSVRLSYYDVVNVVSKCWV